MSFVGTGASREISTAISVFAPRPPGRHGGDDPGAQCDERVGLGAYALDEQARLARRHARDNRNPFHLGVFHRALLSIPSAWIPRPAHAFVDALGRSSLALGLLIVGAGLRIDELIRPSAVAA
jgi:hypothetical protein